MTFRDAVIDTDAITRNTARVRSLAGGTDLIAIVKANGYGHGAAHAARAALAGGASGLGVADIAEGIRLRRDGVDAPILCWLHGDDSDLAEAVEQKVELALSSASQLDRVAALGDPVPVQFKIDTGLSRNGVGLAEWPELAERAAALERAGRIRVTGLMTHLANASEPDDDAALAAFARALDIAGAAGLRPELVHAAATAAAIDRPAARFNTVRIGIGLYGLSPFSDRSAADLGLTPAMTLRGQVAAVRRVPAGTGVSYDYRYRTERETTLALIPLGYADGIPRQASGHGVVRIGEHLLPQVGTIAMDQFVVDAGDAPVAVGDHAVIFGDPLAGGPPVEAWADAASTINYEVVTRIGARVPRLFPGEGA